MSSPKSKRRIQKRPSRAAHGSSPSNCSAFGRPRGKPFECKCAKCKRKFWSYDREYPPRICRTCFLAPHLPNGRDHR